MGQVILIGTLDTKGAEYEYLRACLREAGADRVFAHMADFWPIDR